MPVAVPGADSWICPAVSRNSIKIVASKCVPSALILPVAWVFVVPKGVEAILLVDQLAIEVRKRPFRHRLPRPMPIAQNQGAEGPHWGRRRAIGLDHDPVAPKGQQDRDDDAERLHVVGHQPGTHQRMATVSGRVRLRGHRGGAAYPHEGRDQHACGQEDTAECIMFSPFLRASAVVQGMNMVDPPSCAGGGLHGDKSLVQAHKPLF